MSIRAPIATSPWLTIYNRNQARFKASTQKGATPPCHLLTQNPNSLQHTTCTSAPLASVPRPPGASKHLRSCVRVWELFRGSRRSARPNYKFQSINIPKYQYELFYGSVLVTSHSLIWKECGLYQVSKHAKS